jgi:hypothetical protein
MPRVLAPRNYCLSERMFAGALETRRVPEERRFIESLSGDDGDESWLPLGESARLVDDERVDGLQRPKRLRVRISTLDVAPRPVPTIMDIGVASPNAQGQAMLSTATALTRASAIRGSGPK